MDLDHKMMKKKKKGWLGETGRGKGMGWAIQGLGVGNNVIGYQLVEDGDGSKRITIN